MRQTAAVIGVLLIGLAGLAQPVQCSGPHIAFIYPPGAGTTVLSGSCLIQLDVTAGCNPIVEANARLGIWLGICENDPSRCIGYDRAAPYCIYFDTTRFANGDYYLVVECFDQFDNSANTSTFITIANPTTLPDMQPPQVCIQAPADGYQVPNGKFGTVVINSSVADNIGVTQCDLLVNGTQIASSLVPPFDFTWKPKQQGAYQLQMRAWDGAANSTLSDPVSITK